MAHSDSAEPPAVPAACPGCAGLFPSIAGPVHRYMTSSPGCWRAFGAILAADYSSPQRMAFHQIVVDAYADQHQGDTGPQQVQSVGLHLMTLRLFLEDSVDPKLGTALHSKMVRRPAFHRLQRSGPGALTLLHVSGRRPRGHDAYRGVRMGGGCLGELLGRTRDGPTVAAGVRL